MLDYSRPAGSENEHDRGRNVEKIEAVAAGPADIDHRAREIFWIDGRVDRAIGQLLDERHDFLNALALAMKRDQEFRFRCIIGRIREQHRHREIDVAGGQVHAAPQFSDESLHW